MTYRVYHFTEIKMPFHLTTIAFYDKCTLPLFKINVNTTVITLVAVDHCVTYSRNAAVRSVSAMQTKCLSSLRALPVRSFGMHSRISEWNGSRSLIASCCATVVKLLYSSVVVQ